MTKKGVASRRTPDQNARFHPFRMALWIIFTLIALLGLFTTGLFTFALLNAFVGEDVASFGNVAVIPLTGILLTESGDESFFEQTLTSKRVIDLIEDAAEDDSIDAILLEVNSPGGSPVATDEVAQAIKRAGKPTVTVIREVGASGAYWVATATDHIIANRMSVTGSIGVIGSYLEYADLLTRYNVTYRRLVAGKHKDIESPYKEMTAEEQAIVQKQLDALHAIFIDEVAANRNLSRETVAELATGNIYLGQ
jgi:protease-4